MKVLGGDLCFGRGICAGTENLGGCRGKNFYSRENLGGKGRVDLWGGGCARRANLGTEQI